MCCFSRNSRWREILRRDQRGITGLETAFVLIAFMVGSSVFAFAVLTTGLYSNERANETIQSGLAESRGSMELKGSVILTSSVSGTAGTVSDIAFQVSNAAGGEPIDLTPGKTLIKYTDATQSKMFTSTAGFTATGLGSADSDMLLERKEVYGLHLIDLENSFGVGENTLTNKLGPDTTFTIEVIPPRGAVLFIQRNTPIFLDDSMSLN